jgi:hypothetical protein
VATPSLRRRSKYSTTGNLIGRMDSRSLLSSTHKQLESVSTSIHFQPIISLRRQPASASFQRDMLARSEILALHHSIASARWRKIVAELTRPCIEDRRNKIAPKR